MNQDRLQIGFRIGETVWPVYLVGTNRVGDDFTWVVGLKAQITGLLTTESGAVVCWGRMRFDGPHLECRACPEGDVFRLRREARAEAERRNEVLRLRKESAAK